MKLVCIILCFLITATSVLKRLFNGDKFDNNPKFIKNSFTDKQKTTTGLLNYSRDKLVQIGEQARQSKYRLDPATCFTIRKLKLNKVKWKGWKQRRKRGGKKKYIQQNGVNLMNLQRIKCVPQVKNMVNINMFTVNSRYVESKYLDIRNYFLEENCQFGIITETWLKADSNWNISDLNTNGIKMYPINRKTKGGGVALIADEKYPVTKLYHTTFTSFESGFWQIKLHGKVISVLGIYHPPHSTKNKITDNQFVDEFLELLSIVLPKRNNVVILGDLNLHWNDTTNPLIQIFSDSLEAIGIRQIIEEYTQKDGNILDVIMVDEMLCQQDPCWSVGEFLSDHRYVKAQFKFENLEYLSKKEQVEISKT